MKTVFLGDEQPALTSTVEYLDRTYGKEGALNLASVILVTSSAMANRRLIDHLVVYSNEHDLQLTTPDIITLGQLPEKLYTPKRPFANRLLQQLAFADVLRKSPREALTPIIPDPPTDPHDTRFMDLGELIRRQHVELAADGYDFKRVADEGEKSAEFFETTRWRAMQKIQRAYHDLLDSLEMWDAQTARLVAVQRNECVSDHEIVLLATVDMNQTMRDMIGQVEPKVTALVFAPQEWSGRFDELGCLRAEVWESIDIPLADGDIRLAADHQAQADEMLFALAELGDNYSASDISVAATEDSLAPLLAKELAAAQLPARYGPGKQVSQTAPYLLLQAVAAYVDTQSYFELASLLRHPDVTSWLSKMIAGDWLSHFDEYYANAFTDEFPFGFARKKEKPLSEIDSAISKWLSALAQPAQPIAKWAEPLIEVMLKIYGDRELNREEAADRAVLVACQAIADTLHEMAELPESLAPNVTAREAVAMVLSEIGSQRVGEPPTGANVEIIGWLDMLLDDAPVAIVTSVNEGHLPATSSSDLFLPNSLRSRIGLDDNLRRYARDAYAMSILTRVRKELRLITSRRNSEGYPAIPSRLLFACPEKVAAERALRFFQTDGPPARPSLTHRAKTPPEKSAFEIPQPVAKEVNRLSPTGFKDYIDCPYRFYLKRVLYLRELTDEAEELDPAKFGSLMHEVAARFGLDKNTRDSQDVEVIRDCLHDHLQTCSYEMFGDSPLPSVQVQLEQLRLRLDAFAEAQAEWAGQGWRIFHIEKDDERTETAFEVDGEPITVHGFIDRIDRHQETGQFAILDYKSSDAAKSPEQAHREKEEWVQLQLPLYRYLAKELGVSGDPLMGYILLPRNLDKVGFSLAQWSTAELNQADEKAREIVRNIRNNVFWPPRFPPKWNDEFALICQDRVFNRPEL